MLLLLELENEMENTHASTNTTCKHNYRI